MKQVRYEQLQKIFSKTGYRKYKILILKHQNGLGNNKHREKGC